MVVTVREQRLRRACEQVTRTVADDPAFRHTSHLLVVVGGDVVFDEHLGGERTGDVFSVTKTVLATLCGVAAARGLLPDLRTRVREVLPELVDTPAATQTLHQLMTMTRGCATDGPFDADEVTALPAGQVRRIAEAPQVDPPGQVFRYDNGSAHLLAAVLDRLLPTGLQALAAEGLFGPLGVRDWQWRTDDAGIPYGHAHLRLSAGSLARLGQLWLQGGRWDSEALVDGRYAAAMTTATSTGGPPELLPYGLLCWLDHGDLLAGGWAGQHVLVRRRERAVVVVTGDPGFRFGPPAQDELPPGWRPALELVRRHVLPVLEDGARR